MYDNEYRIEHAYVYSDENDKKEFFNRIKGGGKHVTSRKNKQRVYTNKYGTFDIETSTIYDEQRSKSENRECYESFMYISMFAINGNIIYLRKWEQVQEFLALLEKECQLSFANTMVIYVHNLSYEYEFMKRFVNITNIFATDRHKIIKLIIDDCIEFRCSYYLSNMSLAKFIENTEGTHHNKGINDLDYSIIRTPSTTLTKRELGYCYNDVMGLYECIHSKLKEDTLATIPLTSTGYVRRDCRLASRKDRRNRKVFINSKIDDDMYTMLKKAFRGGNTHASRYMCDIVIDNVYSYDIASSYPFVMIAYKYPISQFMKINEVFDLEELQEYDTMAYICNIYLEDVEIKKGIPIPYIAYSKCEICTSKDDENEKDNSIIFNGRVLKAKHILMTVTDIDLEIIKTQYTFSSCLIDSLYIARKDYLPKYLRDNIYKYFEDKSKLKGDDEHKYEYMKAKNKLNSIYGMTVTDIKHPTYKLNEDMELVEDESTTLKKYFSSYNNFLSFQWGVWVTAYARRQLQRAIDLIGLDMIYCDTDSVKFIGKEHIKEIEELNKDILKYCSNNDIINYVDVGSKRYYLGIFDKEEPYEKFKTLGAKQYAYVQHNKLGITVSGLPKSASKELKEKGGLDAFKSGAIFSKTGRTYAIYNNDNIHTIRVNDEEIQTGSNISIVPTTFTINLTETMANIIDDERSVTCDLGKRY